MVVVSYQEKLKELEAQLRTLKFPFEAEETGKKLKGPWYRNPKIFEGIIIGLTSLLGVVLSFYVFNTYVTKLYINNNIIISLVGLLASIIGIYYFIRREQEIHLQLNAIPMLIIYRRNMEKEENNVTGYKNCYSNLSFFHIRRACR